jgi:nascent polypeptide-associated complex subunit alpha
MRINPRQIEKAMKRMGMQATQIEAEEVIIKTPEKDIVITSPHVTKMNAMGQETFQIAGEVEERGKEKFIDDDVKMVMEKAGVGEPEAKRALEQEGDIASAILKLKH